MIKRRIINNIQYQKGMHLNLKTPQKTKTIFKFRKKQLLFGSIAVILIIACSSIYFFFFSQKWKDISYNKGLKNLNDGKFSEATKNFEKALSGDNESDALYRLAVSKYNQKDFEGASESYLKAIKKDPSNQLAYNGLGNLYRDQKEYIKAEENYRKAIALDENYVIAYSNLAIMFMDNGKNSEAEGIIDKGLEKNPDSPELKNIKNILGE